MRIALPWPRKILLFTVGLMGLSVLLTAGLTVRAATALWEREFADHNASFARYTSLDILHAFGQAFGGEVTPDLTEAIRVLTANNGDLLGVMVLSRSGRTLYSSLDPGREPPPLLRAAEVGKVIDEGAARQATYRAGGRRVLDVLAPAAGLGGNRPLAVRYLFGYGSLERKIASLLRWVAAGALLLLLVGAALSAHLSRLLTLPLAELSAGAARVAAGDRGHRIRLDTGDELTDVAGSVNRMVDALTDASREVTALQERLLRNERLAALGQLSAGVSHELDNPVGVILGYAQLLREEPPGPARESGEIISAEAQRCRRIIAGLLDFARAGGGAPERFDLGEALRPLAASLAEQRPLRRLRWETEGLRAGFMVEMDPDALRAVLLNLALNAAQAMGGEGTFSLALSRRSGEGREGVLLTVSDSGGGIPAGAEEKVFEPFYTTKRRGEGTGLGLPLCRKQVEEAGGWIRALPSREGAVFGIWLPLSGGER